MNEEIREVRTTCSYCGVGCGMRVQVRNGRIAAVVGDEAHPVNRGMLCTKGRELHRTVHRRDRLVRPHLRSSRSHPFAPVDWDDALGFAAERMAEILRRRGPEAVAFYLSGQLLTEDYYAFNKLGKGFIGTPHLDTNSRLCMSSAVAAYKRAFGADGPPICYDDIERASCFFIVGANPAWAHPILFRRMEAAKEANPALRVIVVDPRRTDTCSIADLHLALRPGTDLALLLAMFHVLLWEGLIDEAFIAKHTKGFEQAADAARAWTPRKAASVCGLDAAEIVRTALWFAENDTLSFWCQGINQSTHGTDAGNALINLHLATGKIGKPGNGPFSLTGQSNAMGGREVGGLANMLAAHRDYDARDEVARFWQAPRVPQGPGKTAVEIFDALEKGEIEAIWIVCTNPLVSLPNRAQIERALRKAQLVIVSDAYFPTDTAMLAHLVLPAAGWGEKEGTITNSERRILRVRKAVPAPGLARPDWMIASMFARRLATALGEDWGDAFSWRTAAEVFDEHRRLARGRLLDIGGLSHALLDAQGPQRWPYPEGARRDTPRLYCDFRFATPDRKARFVPVSFREPVEKPDREYPFSLLTGRVRDQWHTMTKTGRVSRLMQHAPAPFLSLHPEDAKELGVAEEDLVRVVSRRGRAIAKVHIDAGMRRRCAFLPMHWPELFARAVQANALTINALDPVSKQPELKHAAVRIERFEPAWRGVLLLAGDRIELARRMMQGFTYAVVYCDGEEHPVTTVELACVKPLSERQMRRLDLMLEQGKAMDVLVYRDRQRAIQRKAWLEEDRLVAVRWIGPDLSEAEWLRKLMLEGREVGELRPFLLAPNAPIAKEDPKGRIVCACRSVGEKEIRAAIAAGATTLDAIRAKTLAATGCGSCVPEIKRLLAEGK